MLRNLLFLQAIGLMSLLAAITTCGGCVREPDTQSGDIALRTRVLTFGEGSSIDIPDGTSVGLCSDTGSGFQKENLCYIASYGTLEPSSDKLRYPADGSNANIYAYSPYKEGGIVYNYFLDVPIETDQRNKGTAASDILWGRTIGNRTAPSTEMNLSHRMSRIKIYLTSGTGADISNAFVAIIGIWNNAFVDLRTGNVSRNPSVYTTGNVLMQHNTDGSYEAVIMPQTTSSNSSDFLRIVVGDRVYTYKPSEDKTFEAGKEYRFDITLKDAPRTLPFKISVTYDGKLLSDHLTVPAKAEPKSLSMTASPVNYNTFKIRNNNGEYCWARLSSTASIVPDEIAHNLPYSQLLFDENFGEERTMLLEFYDKNSPNDIYKQVQVTQSASVNYLLTGSESTSVDRLGNVYDIPYELDVKSNQNWKIDNPNGWINVNYLPGTMNQTVKVTVAINDTGSKRSGQLFFTIDGKTLKTFTVSQSAVESNLFTLKYELNLDFTTPKDDFFRYLYPNTEHYFYANTVDIFNHYRAEYGDAVARFTSDSKYGLVADAPSSFRHLVIRGFKHDKFFTYRNYSGNAVVLRDETFLIINREVIYPFYFPFNIDIPLPAGVKRNQKVILSMTFTDTGSGLDHYSPTITTEIVNQ